jgi:ech hydrogenase subunit F
MPYFSMTGLTLKWAFRKPATRNYPFEPRAVLSGSRGQLVFDKTSCVYCGICSKKCPADALLVHRPGKKWAIDRLRCIVCGFCVEACPKNSLTLSTGHGEPFITKDIECHLA